MKGDDSPFARAYTEYYQACLAGDLDKIRSFLVSKNQKELDSYDKKMLDMVIEVLKMRPTKITIVKQVVTDDTATFTVKGVYTAGEISTGSIKMVFEDMKWKVAEDKWETSSQ